MLQIVIKYSDMKNYKKLGSLKTQMDFHECKPIKSIIMMVVSFWLMFAVTPLYAQTDQQDDNSTPIPTGRALVLQPGIGLRYSVNKKIRLYQDFRSYFNQSNPSKNFEELSFGARYYHGKINKLYFSSTAGYLMSLDSSYRVKAYRPKLYFTVDYRQNNFTFQVRNRLEYNIVTGNNSGSSLRYRPRILLKERFRLNHFSVTPYIYNEFFFGQNGFSQNRTKVAIFMKYHDWGLTVGNLFKVVPGYGLTENRVSLDLSYSIPTIHKKNPKDKH